jgi:hypothetical protein
VSGERKHWMLLVSLRRLQLSWWPGLGRRPAEDFVLQIRREIERGLILVELATGGGRAQAVCGQTPDRRFDQLQAVRSRGQRSRWHGEAGGLSVGGGPCERPGQARRRPSTASRRAVRARARNGLVTKSSAPSSNTRTSLSSSPLAVSTIIGISRVAGRERSC